uniref:Uncharacterized protein n=1 Tax=Nelumbo nucifera TaxID=4432 RepID=A0A822XS40_NELNU|nr:TPA_asm: hypothetical protein HUJ06_023362 [Nelumbo nucifera]
MKEYLLHKTEVQDANKQSAMSQEACSAGNLRLTSICPNNLKFQVIFFAF